MKIQLIVEILVLCALLAFASARVIDSTNSFDSHDFTSRLISNVTKGTKNRQNEIVVGGADYDDPIGSGEISVGEEDLIATNNVPTDPIASPGVVSVEENNSVAVAESEITEAPVNIDDAHPLNRYCTCNEQECNCCREFKLPLVSVRGPGCASLRYLGKNRMSIAIKYGDITLTSRTISGRKARPVCLGLPGGFSQFCGRVYGINREADDFQACLGLELRAEDEVEAALRVSCFKFGPKGLKMTDAQPLPPVAESVDEDDEDGDGILGLVTGAGGNEDEDDEEYEDDEEEGGAAGQNTSGDEDADLLGLADDDDDADEDDDDDDDDEEGLDDDDDDDDDAVAPAADYPSGFSLLDGIFGDSTANKKKKPVQTRNKVTTAAEDVKLNQVGTKVKIANSPGILNSAALSQNEIDNTITKDTPAVAAAATATKLDPVDLEPVAAAAPVEVIAKPVVAAAVKPVAEEKPKPALSSVVAGLESNAGVPLVSTTPKPKKKQSTSILDTIESLIAGDDEDDDDDEEEEAEKDEEPEDDDDDDEEEEEEAEKEEEPEDDEEEVLDDDDDEEDDAAAPEEVEDEPEDDDEEEEETVADDATKVTNDKESVSVEGDAADKKKTKKKNDFGLGFFARLMKLI